MTFDIEDVLFVVNPGTALSLLAVGIVFGALFFRDRRQQRAYIFAVWLVGVVFAATMAATRYLQASKTWEGWLGDAILWGIYAIGMGIGSYVGNRLSRRLARS